MGETRIDLHHLLQDLADAYPGGLEETVLTEIVANSLDSGARCIRLVADPHASTLSVIDDGVGMRRAELRRFHDVATSTKVRGDGIGFAGVGIKLGLLLSAEVLTETRRGKDHVATTWGLSTRKRAPWRWIEPPALIAEHGTAVRLRFENPLSPLLDAGFLETTLRRHFTPLFDATFDDVLRDHYGDGVAFEINAQPLMRRGAGDLPGQSVPLSVRLAHRRKPSAFGYLARVDRDLPEDARGLAISTLGKVIKGGWDWLGVVPADAERITGLIEVPALAACLTLNKVDFIRAGPRGATYLAYRKALQEAVSSQLAAWGDEPNAGRDPRRRAARPVERDVEQILIDLADDFPMLAMLVERRAGGKKRLPTGSGGGSGLGDTMDLFADEAPDEPPSLEERPSEVSPVDQPPPSPPADRSPAPRAPEVGAPATKGPRRPTRLGLTIQFESRPEDLELGRLVETTVWVNDAHPAYVRAAASRSESYHVALSVAMALARIAVEPTHERTFITEFLARWGESVSGRKRRAPKRGRKLGMTRRLSQPD